MSVGFKRIKHIIIVLLAMVGLSHSAYIKKEITCYVCTPHIISDDMEVKEIYNSFPNDIESIPNCGSNTAINFTLKCPVGYKGCLTKTYDKKTLKSCNEYAITDCKIANNVKYCFCANNLCNDASILTPIPHATDDEDLDQSIEDGSGLFDDWTQLNKNKYTKHNINTTIINDSSTKNISTTKASAATSFFHKNISILILILICYEITLFQKFSSCKL